MRSGVVYLSTLQRENRWDPAYYLGPSPDQLAAVERAKLRLHFAQVAVERANAEVEVAKARSIRFITDGTVVT